LALLFAAQYLTQVATALFEAVGAPANEARLAARELVTSNLMGLDSHGVLRVPEYLDLVAKGDIVPGAAIQVERRSLTAAVVDCGLNFGAVGGHAAMRTAMEMARDHKTACVLTCRCNHVGRLGAYVQAAAEQDFIGLATCNSPIYGQFVLPWGGRQGRLATNPIAYAVPTRGDPILADFSTSVVPEGKIRYYKNEGRPLPIGWVLDAQGQPTTDAAAFYGPPMGGILPLGGAAGHKGFALGLLVEILGSALAGISSTDTQVVGNGVCFIVIDPAAFCPHGRFKELMDDLVRYMKSSPPLEGVEEVLVPGELEFRTMRRREREGIPVDEVTWQAIQAHAERLRVDLVAGAK
jgi:uncharacterized oxidoreductase